ncbi:MAG: serine protease, partial [Candidatus Omnitrophota bacterium]
NAVIHDLGDLESAKLLVSFPVEQSRPGTGRKTVRGFFLTDDGELVSKRKQIGTVAYLEQIYLIKTGAKRGADNSVDGSLLSGSPASESHQPIIASSPVTPVDNGRDNSPHGSPYKVILTCLGQDNTKWKTQSHRGVYQYTIRKMQFEDIENSQLDEMLKSVFPKTWMKHKDELVENVNGENWDAFILVDVVTGELAGMFVYAPPSGRIKLLVGGIWIIAVRPKYRATGAIDILLLYLKSIIYQGDRMRPQCISAIITRKSNTVTPKTGMFLVKKMNETDSDDEFVDFVIKNLRLRLDIKSVVTLKYAYKTSSSADGSSKNTPKRYKDSEKIPIILAAVARVRARKSKVYVKDVVAECGLAKGQINKLVAKLNQERPGRAREVLGIEPTEHILRHQARVKENIAERVARLEAFIDEALTENPGILITQVMLARVLGIDHTTFSSWLDYHKKDPRIQHLQAKIFKTTMFGRIRSQAADLAARGEEVTENKIKNGLFNEGISRGGYASWKFRQHFDLGNYLEENPLTKEEIDAKRKPKLEEVLPAKKNKADRKKVKTHPKEKEPLSLKGLIVSLDNIEQVVDEAIADRVGYDELWNWWSKAISALTKNITQINDFNICYGAMVNRVAGRIKALAHLEERSASTELNPKNVASSVAKSSLKCKEFKRETFISYKSISQFLRDRRVNIEGYNVILKYTINNELMVVRVLHQEHRGNYECLEAKLNECGVTGLSDFSCKVLKIYIEHPDNPILPSFRVYADRQYRKTSSAMTSGFLDFEIENKARISKRNMELLSSWVSTWVRHNKVEDAGVITITPTHLVVRTKETRMIALISYKFENKTLTINGQFTFKYPRTRIMALLQSFLIYNFSAQKVRYEGVFKKNGTDFVNGMKTIGIFSSVCGKEANVNANFVEALVKGREPFHKFLDKEAVFSSSAVEANQEMLQIIPNSRVFASVQGGPLPVRIEFSPEAYTVGFKDETARKIVDVASRKDIRGAVQSGRSFILALPESSWLRRDNRVYKAMRVVVSGDHRDVDNPKLIQVFVSGMSPFVDSLENKSGSSSTALPLVESKTYGSSPAEFSFDISAAKLEEILFPISKIKKVLAEIGEDTDIYCDPREISKENIVLYLRNKKDVVARLSMKILRELAVTNMEVEFPFEAILANKDTYCKRELRNPLRVYKNINPIACVDHFSLAARLQHKRVDGKTIGQWWYDGYLEPYLVRRGFSVIAVTGNCITIDYIKEFFSRRGFNGFIFLRMDRGKHVHMGVKQIDKNIPPHNFVNSSVCGLEKGAFKQRSSSPSINLPTASSLAPAKQPIDKTVGGLYDDLKEARAMAKEQVTTLLPIYKLLAGATVVINIANETGQKIGTGVIIGDTEEKFIVLTAGHAFCGFSVKDKVAVWPVSKNGYAYVNKQIYELPIKLIKYDKDIDLALFAIPKNRFQGDNYSLPLPLKPFRARDISKNICVVTRIEKKSKPFHWYVREAANGSYGPNMFVINRCMRKGDSGAPVIDHHGNIVGIIIKGSQKERQSLAISGYAINNFLKGFSVDKYIVGMHIVGPNSPRLKQKGSSSTALPQAANDSLEFRITQQITAKQGEISALDKKEYSLVLGRAPPEARMLLDAPDLGKFQAALQKITPQGNINLKTENRVDINEAISRFTSQPYAYDSQRERVDNLKAALRFLFKYLPDVYVFVVSNILTLKFCAGAGKSLARADTAKNEAYYTAKLGGLTREWIATLGHEALHNFLSKIDEAIAGGVIGEAIADHYEYCIQEASSSHFGAAAFNDNEPIDSRYWGDYQDYIYERLKPVYLSDQRFRAELRAILKQRAQLRSEIATLNWQLVNIRNRRVSRFSGDSAVIYDRALVLQDSCSRVARVKVSSSASSSNTEGEKVIKFCPKEIKFTLANNIRIATSVNWYTFPKIRVERVYIDGKVRLYKNYSGSKTHLEFSADDQYIYFRFIPEPGKEKSIVTDRFEINQQKRIIKKPQGIYSLTNYNSGRAFVEFVNNTDKTGLEREEKIAKLLNGLAMRHPELKEDVGRPLNDRRIHLGRIKIVFYKLAGYAHMSFIRDRMSPIGFSYAMLVDDDNPSNRIVFVIYDDKVVALRQGQQEVLHGLAESDEYKRYSIKSFDIGKLFYEAMRRIIKVEYRSITRTSKAGNTRHYITLTSKLRFNLPRSIEKRYIHVITAMEHIYSGEPYSRLPIYFVEHPLLEQEVLKYSNLTPAQIEQSKGKFVTVRDDEISGHTVIGIVSGGEYRYYYRVGPLSDNPAEIIYMDIGHKDFSDLRTIIRVSDDKSAITLEDFKIFEDSKIKGKPMIIQGKKGKEIYVHLGVFLRLFLEETSPGGLRPIPREVAEKITISKFLKSLATDDLEEIRVYTCCAIPQYLRRFPDGTLRAVEIEQRHWPFGREIDEQKGRMIYILNSTRAGLTDVLRTASSGSMSTIRFPLTPGYILSIHPKVRHNSVNKTKKIYSDFSYDYYFDMLGKPVRSS